MTVKINDRPDKFLKSLRSLIGQIQGGFNEVGETSEDSVRRELQEEMNIALPGKPVLFGVYNDSLRDTRRHTTSIVYRVDLPENVVPHAGDDATDVQRIALGDIDKL